MISPRKLLAEALSIDAGFGLTNGAKARGIGIENIRSVETLRCARNGWRLPFCGRDALKQQEGDALCGFRDAVCHREISMVLCDASIMDLAGAIVKVVPASDLDVIDIADAAEAALDRAERLLRSPFFKLRGDNGVTGELSSVKPNQVPS